MHELLAKEMEDARDSHLAYEVAATQAELPANHASHPVVRANPEEVVWPISIFMDGVAVTKRDGVFVVTMQNLVTGKRWLICALKKSTFCRCGCRSWCSLWHLMAFLNWSAEALAKGEMPSVRHVGTPFLQEDSRRAAMAGGKILREPSANFVVTGVSSAGP